MILLITTIIFISSQVQVYGLIGLGIFHIVLDLSILTTLVHVKYLFGTA